MNLHTHSEYSYKDAISKVKEIAQKQKDLGYDYFCITDHGQMAAFPDAFKTAKEMNMKFIPGIEFYLQPPADFDLSQKVLESSEANKILGQKRASEDQKLEARKIIDKWDKVDARKNFHITVLAKNQEGLENLFRIYSEGHTYYKYRVSTESLMNHKEGLYVLSGCLGSELSYYIKTRKIDLAESLIKKYKEAFGDNYYIEIQFHNIVQRDEEKEKGYMSEKEIYLEMINLAIKHNVKMVAANDSHFIREEDARLHNIYKSICYYKTDDQKTGELTFDGHGYHMVSREELSARFKEAGYTEIDSMFDNIDKIAESVDPNIDIKGFNLLVDRNKELRELVLKGWEEIRKGTPREEQSLKQLEWELSVIEGKNFSNYFINVKRIVDRAKELGILIGPGRGSGAGSEVVRLLNITKVDPLKYGLIFERFMNPSRFAMPDIDLDFESRIEGEDGRLGSDLIMESLEDTYKFFGKIGNIVGGSPLVLFKKLASLRQVPFSEANKFTTTDISKSIFEASEKPAEETFKTLVENLGLKYSAEWAKVYEDLDVCFKLGNIPFGSSIHASGKIMTEEETNLPLDDKGVINFNGANLEDYGYTKFDLLSLDTLNPIKKIYGLDIDWDDTSDEKAWEVLNNADTDYIFQFQGNIPKKMLKEVNVTNIDQLAEITAINRPGPLALQLHEKWIEIQNGKGTFTDEDFVIKHILRKAFGPTHSGMVIYQEDVMKIFQDGAGFSLGESDDVRRAMGKKKLELMHSFKERFLKDWKYNELIEVTPTEAFLPSETIKLSNGEEITAKLLYERNQAGEAFVTETGYNIGAGTTKKNMGNPEKIWDMLEGFARYAFNKSHSVAYALVSYQAAKIWGNKKEEYLEWLINNTSGAKKQMALKTCKKLGLKLIFPHYSCMKKIDEFKIEDGKVFVPIGYEGSFECLSDFIFGDMPPFEKSGLALMGIFDTVIPDRLGLAELIQSIPNKKNYIPTFPKTNSLTELIRNGELLDLWTIEDENERFIRVNVIRTRSIKEVMIYKNKTSLTDDRLEFNIKQDIKRFGIIKPGQLSEFPELDLDNIMAIYGKYKEKIVESDKKYIRDLLKKEFSNLIYDPKYKRTIEEIKDTEHLVLFKEQKHHPDYGYSKVVLEFEDGDHLFFTRDDEMISKIRTLNKGKLYRVMLTFDWYINKNLDVVTLFKLQDIITE